MGTRTRSRPRRRATVPLKGVTITALVRQRIADGALKPGARVPSGAALARETGCGDSTARKALRALVADGTLVRGPSRQARLRVAPLPGADDETAPATRLARALAARRHAHGLSQQELAAMIDMSTTAVGHAETSRGWQSRRFWERADAVLGDTGDLLRMYDEWRLPGVAVPWVPPVPMVLPVSVTITRDGVVIVWPDGTETVTPPPGAVRAAGENRDEDGTRG